MPPDLLEISQPPGTQVIPPGVVHRDIAINDQQPLRRLSDRHPQGRTAGRPGEDSTDYDVRGIHARQATALRAGRLNVKVTADPGVHWTMKISYYLKGNKDY
ncbi:hypothetical protein GCM10027589_00590 [Actinocorallia lasiicapitis]